MNATEMLKNWDSMNYFQRMTAKREIEDRRGHDPCLSKLLPELLAMQEEEQEKAEARARSEAVDKRITAVEEWIISQARTQNDLFRLAMDLMRRVEYLENSAMVIQKTPAGAKLFAPINERVV